MTDPQQAHSKPGSVKAMAITLLAGAIAGSIIGLVAWSLLLATNQAVAVVSIGRYGLTQFSLIEEPQAVIERIKSTGFGAAAAARAGIPELSSLLPARQYGGSGALTARSLRDPSLIEIRVNLTQPELALKAITAVVDELIAGHAAQAEPLIHNLQSILTVLDKHASEMIKASDSITKRLSGSSQDGVMGQDSTALLSARALSESGLAALTKNETEIRGLLFNISGSRVIAAPSVTAPQTTSLYQVIVAGTLAGLLAGLLLIQIFPGFFPTGRSRSEISRPDPV